MMGGEKAVGGGYMRLRAAVSQWGRGLREWEGDGGGEEGGGGIVGGGPEGGPKDGADGRSSAEQPEQEQLLGHRPKETVLLEREGSGVIPSCPTLNPR